MILCETSPNITPPPSSSPLTPIFDPEKSRVRGQQGASSVEGPPCWPVPVSRAVLGRPLGLQSTQRIWAAMEPWRSSSETSRSQRPASTPARPLMPTRRSLPRKSALKLLVSFIFFYSNFLYTYSFIIIFFYFFLEKQFLIKHIMLLIHTIYLKN